jgi:hypothetical protein
MFLYLPLAAYLTDDSIVRLRIVLLIDVWLPLSSLLVAARSHLDRANMKHHFYSVGKDCILFQYS